ncbi:MAG TPA: hypothetical protein VMD47_10405 [Candidatus Acidoferrales bacterium]|nr:hypothetical protein [Candidatus Acidoferrales bacterium]
MIAGTMLCCFACTACGGGGGGSGSAPATSNPAPTVAPSMTTASGTVVDDGTGSPLAGVNVKLMPWSPCGATPSPATSITPQNDGCPTPLPSPQATTASNGTFVLNGAPNGHYLLIIGADAVATVPPGYTTPPSSCAGTCPTPSPVPGAPIQATVHDNVTLTGGNQTLVAPTLPTVPSGYTAPAWETNGDYRLATLNATSEMPCLIAWQYERAQNSLAGSSVDEWLLENVRAGNAYAQVASAGSSLPSISTGGDAASGGVACATQIGSSFVAGANAYTTNPRTLWFAGQYLPYGYDGNTSVSAMGLAEFPIDPRSYTDPNHPTWP